MQRGSYCHVCQREWTAKNQQAQEGTENVYLVTAPQKRSNTLCMLAVRESSAWPMNATEKKYDKEVPRTEWPHNPDICPHGWHNKNCPTCSPIKTTTRRVRRKKSVIAAEPNPTEHSEEWDAGGFVKKPARRMAEIPKRSTSGNSQAVGTFEVADGTSKLNTMMNKLQASLAKWIYLGWTIVSHTVQAQEYGRNLAPKSAGALFMYIQAFINLYICYELWQHEKK